jgi:hypothetical protein
LGEDDSSDTLVVVDLVSTSPVSEELGLCILPWRLDAGVKNTEDAALDDGFVLWLT